MSVEFTSYFEEIRKLQRVVDKLLPKQDSTLRVLEAGCGSMAHLAFDARRTHITGIDISEKQLQSNRLINERIAGDIQTYIIKNSYFDVIVCWNVLEHIEHPERALQNLISATNPGGILIVAAPNLFSLKGLVTKLTPHWFHVLFYRHVLRIKAAGTEDVGPFVAPFRRTMTPSAVRRIAQENNFSVEYCHLYSNGMEERLRAIRSPFNLPIDLLQLAVRILTLGMIDLSLTDYHIVLRKPFADSASLAGKMDGE